METEWTMAEKPKKKLVVTRKRETIRERATKSAHKASRVPRTRKLATTAGQSASKISGVLRREYTPIKTGTSKTGTFLGARRSATPRYFTQSFREFKNITWPSFGSALKLTFAVLVFSVVMATFIRALDFGFDKLFKEVILK